jgi:hypothetical protein
MATINQLYTTLTDRFKNGQYVVQATDFEGDTATFFETTIGSTLSFSADSIISNLINNTFSIIGQASTTVIGTTQVALMIDSTIGLVLKTNQGYSNWRLGTLFPTLKTTYLDFIEFSTVYLYLSSFDLYIPSDLGLLSLKKGLNLYGTTTITEALAPINGLFSNLNTINLTGTIAIDDQCSLVSLQGGLPNLEGSSTNNILYLTYDSTQPDLTPSGLMVGTLNRGAYSFKQTIEIIFDISPLAKLEAILREHLLNGVLNCPIAELGEPLATNIKTILNIDTLIFNQATLQSTNTQITLTGTTAFMGLPETTPFELDIIQQDKTLNWMLYSNTLPNKGFLASMLPQTKNSFFDNVDFTIFTVIASSYATPFHVQPDVSINLVEGINVYAITNNTRGLFRLQEFGDFYETITLQGTISPNGTVYDLNLQTVAATTDLALNLLGFQPITFKAPQLSLQSVVIAEGVLNTAFISGTFQSQTLDYPAKIVVPVDYSPDFLILPDDDLLGLENIVSILSLSKDLPIVSYFPTELINFNNISVKGPNIKFTLLGRQRATAESLMTLVDMDATPRYWTLLNSPTIEVGHLRVGILYGYFGLDEAHKDSIFGGSIGGSIAIGSTVSVDIDLFVPIKGDWRLKTVSTVSLSDIAAFTGKPSDDLAQSLPSGLFSEPLNSVASSIEMAFDPFKPSFSYIDFNLQQTGKWTIIENILSLDNWVVSLRLDGTQNYAITGNLHGFITIGQSQPQATDGTDNPFANIEVNLPIPAAAEGWTFGLAEDSIINLPSIGDLLTGMGVNTTNLPSGFTTFGQFDITKLAINFNPSPATLNWFKFDMQSRKKWILIPRKLIITDIAANLNINRKTESLYDSTGFIYGFIRIYDTAISIRVSKKSPDTNWKLGLCTETPIHIPGLNELASWMLPTAMGDYLPNSFMPFAKGFDLTDLSIDFDISQNTLDKAQFEIMNSATWDAIPGYLSFDHVLVKASIANFNQKTQALSVRLEATLTFLEEAKLLFTADRQTAPNVDSPWWFTVALTNSVSLTALIQKSNLNTDLVVPSNTWLPDINLTKLVGNMIPARGIYNIMGTAELACNVPFINVQLPLTSLGGSIDIQQLTTNTPEQNYKKGSIFGTLDFGSLQTILSLQLGTEGVDTIFTATLTADELTKLSISELSNNLIAAPATTPSNNSTTSETDYWADLTPDDFNTSQLAFEAAYVYFNQTQKQFFLYGSVKNLGSAILLAQSVKADATATEAVEQGILAAFAVADNFKFGTLFSSLSPVDDVITIRNASLVINSYPTTDAQTLKTQIESLLNNPFAPTAVSPFKVTQFSDNEVQKGLHLFAAFDFSSALFTRLLDLQKLSTEPDVTLYAFFPQGTNDASGTIFSAEFAEFSIFDTLIFKGASQTINGIAPYKGPFFQYTATSLVPDTSQPQQPNGSYPTKSVVSTEFSFIGQLGITAFDQTLAFDTAMVVNQDFAAIYLAPPVNNGQNILPFPDVVTDIVTIKNLGLTFKYTFAQQDTPSVYKVELDLYGSVSILDTIDFDGHLYFSSTETSSFSPVLMEIILTSNLSISTIINKLVSETGAQLTWPADLFDITFLKQEQNATTKEVTQKSRLYYYDEDKDGQQTPSFIGYTTGYNLEATIVLTILIDLKILMTLNVQPGKGVKATVSLEHPIDLYILQLAGTTQSTSGDKLYLNGPELVLDTMTTPNSPMFGFATGFNFLQKPFGTAEILFGNETSDDKKYLLIQGKLTSALDFEPFNLKGKSLSFSYSEPNGFQVTGWPDFLAVFGDILKVMKAMEQICSLVEGGCAEIVDFVADTVFNTKFQLTGPRFYSEGDDLYFEADGSYSIVLLNEVTVCTVNFPEALKVPILKPTDFSLDNLFETIAQTIGDTALNFVEALIDNPEELAKFIGIVCAKNAGKIAAQMLCRGMIDESVSVAIESAAAIVSPELGLLEVEAELVTDAAVEAGAIAGATAETIATAVAEVVADIVIVAGAEVVTVVVAEVVVDVVVVAGVLIGATAIVVIGTAAVVVIGSAIVVEASTIITDVYTTHGAGHSSSKPTQPTAPPQPNVPILKYLNYENGQMAAGWGGVMYAASYELSIKTDSGTNVFNKNVGTQLSQQVQLSPSTAAPSYTAKVRSIRGDFRSEWSNTATLSKLVAPLSISIVFDETNRKLVISWQPVPNATLYDVVILKDNASQTTQTIANPNYEIANDLLPVGSYQAIVMAKGGVTTIPSNTNQSSVIVKVAPPTNMRIVLDKTQQIIKATWGDVADNNGYKVQVLAADNQVIPITVQTTTKPEVSINFGDLLGKLPCTLQVQTLSSADWNSPFVNATPVISQIAAPEGLVATWNKKDNTMIVSWQEVAQNNGYNLQLLDGEGNIIEDNVISVETVTIDLANISPVKVQVQTLSVTQLDSVFTSTLFVKQQIQPILAVNWEVDKVLKLAHLTWTNVEGNSGYYFELLNVCHDIVQGSECTLLANTTTHSLDLDSLANIEPTPLTIRIQTLSDTLLDSTFFSDSNPCLRRIAAPEGLVATWNKKDNTMTVIWQEVAENNGYKVQLLDDKDIIIEDNIILTDISVQTVTINLAGISPATVQVQTLSMTQLDSVFTSTLFVKQQIQAIDGLVVNWEIDKVLKLAHLTWTNVEGNSGYYVRILNSQLNSVQNSVTILPANKTNITLDFNIFDTLITPLTIQVQALSDTELNSNFCSYSNDPLLIPIAPPEDILATWQPNAYDIKVTWKDVPDNEGYKVRFRNDKALCEFYLLKGQTDMTLNTNRILDTYKVDLDSATTLVYLKTLSATRLDSNFVESEYNRPNPTDITPET